MKTRNLHLVTFLGLSLAAFACGHATDNSTVVSSSDETTITGKVLRCSDGDTCQIKIPGESGTLKVRMIGIDAPETAHGGFEVGQPLGPEAKAKLNELIKDKTVKVRQIDEDMYGRTLGEIILAEKIINMEMLRLGFAETYIWSNSEVNAPAYKNAQKEAKNATRGIWALEDYESPQDYRARIKALEEEAENE